VGQVRKERAGHLAPNRNRLKHADCSSGYRLCHSTHCDQCVMRDGGILAPAIPMASLISRAYCTPQCLPSQDTGMYRSHSKPARAKRSLWLSLSWMALEQ